MGLPAWADPVLNSAILPNARVVPVGETATIFMTTLNSGDMDATNCQVVVSSTIGFGLDPSTVDFSWVLTDATGGLIGNVNDPFTIPADGLAQLVLGIDTAGGQLIFHVECDGGFGSLGWPAVNGASITFSNLKPDIIPIIQTLSGDGIANFDPVNGLAGVSVAAINNTAIINGTGEEPIGIGGAFVGFSKAGQFDFFACETDSTGACIGDINTCPSSQFTPCFTAMIGATPKTFSFFPILPPGQGAPFLPQLYRFAPSFHDSFGNNNATTSVALDSAPPGHLAGAPVGTYEVRMRNTNDLGARTLRQGRIVIGDNSLFGTLFRAIDRGIFISVVQQHFDGTGNWTEVGGGNTCSDTQPTCTTEMTAAMHWIFYDTGAGAESDGAVTDGQCTIQPAEGGSCTIPDMPGEQVAGEPDLFDALEESTVLFGGDLSSLITLSHFLAKPLLSTANENFVFDTTIETGVGFVSFKLDGCQFDNITPNFDIEQNVVTGANLTIGACDPGSPLEPLKNQTVTARFFLNDTAPDGSCTYRLVVILDPGNPNSKTYTFFIKTAPPLTGADTFEQASATPSRKEQAQTLANLHHKPVYWHINGKDVLVATPENK
jgi:hypothetical protein